MDLFRDEKTENKKLTRITENSKTRATKELEAMNQRLIEKIKGRRNMLGDRFDCKMGKC